MPDTSDGVDRWLTENALPLQKLSPGGPFDDLEPLRGVLRDVRVLGMGESTHGTREFFRLKHRILQFLVREMGFTALAMEASESAARALDAYVNGGPGDAVRLIARLGFWTWRTQEIVELV
ncbi:erythromycin esterase family protein, partial [Streptomyces scabiei]|uniref:erythromycin esterase family protein n=1 Tax=Streptomyces scabiei TaxID=1930 RepID=UPI0039EE268D